MDISQPALSTPAPSPKLQGCVPQKGRGCTDFPQLTWLLGLQSLQGIASHLLGTGCCHLLLLGCLHLPCETGLGFEFIFNKLTIWAVELVIKFLAFREPICSSPCSQKFSCGSYPNLLSLKIYFNVIFPFILMSSKWFLSFIGINIYCGLEPWGNEQQRYLQFMNIIHWNIKFMMQMKRTTHCNFWMCWSAISRPDHWATCFTGKPLQVDLYLHANSDHYPS